MNILLSDAELEQAARKYCELKGLNPDDTIVDEEALARQKAPDASGMCLTVCLSDPTCLRWEEAARRIKDMDIMGAAYESVRYPD